MIYILGDSHVETFRGIPGVEPRWQGPWTAYRLWSKHQFLKRAIDHVPEDAEIWFCFGELDCRIHIWRQAQKWCVDWGCLAEVTVEMYQRYLMWHWGHEHRIRVMVVPPQGVQENNYGYEHYATREQRQEITNLFNEHLLWSMPVLRKVDIWGSSGVWPETDFQENGSHMDPAVARVRLESYLCDQC